MTDHGRDVYRPTRRHACNAGWAVGTDGTYRERDPHAPLGTVWRCDCGRTWVAYLPPPGRIVVCLTQWRPEGRLERWWRELRRGDHGTDS